MLFKDGCQVLTAEGQDVGRIDRVVLDPGTKAVTHLVVRKGVLFTEDKLVAVDWVAGATPERIVLNVRAEALAQLPLFEETHYVPVNTDAMGLNYTTGYARPIFAYPPIGSAWPYQPVMVYLSDTERNIPNHTVALKEGSAVVSADGKAVGYVERIVADTNTDQATHLVIVRGLLGREHTVIPIQWVKRIDERQVSLAVDARQVDSLKNDQAAHV